MRIGRWIIRFERVQPECPFLFDKAALRLEDFAQYPDNSVVRNQRTGENVLVRPPRRPDEIVRGIGAVGPMPVLPDDEWISIVPCVEWAA